MVVLAFVPGEANWEFLLSKDSAVSSRRAESRRTPQCGQRTLFCTRCIAQRCVLSPQSRTSLFAQIARVENQLAEAGKATTVAAPMSKNAGIAKTRKAHSKRFKITATGKVLRRKQGKRHILVAKNRKRKRNLGKVAVVHETDAAAIKANMPWS
jgi:large subunit ribosomal protein L35